MAKVTVLSPKLHESQQNLVRSLSQLQHEVTIISSRKAGIGMQPQEPVWAYFDKWSAKEALLLGPRLLLNPPDILHFVFTDFSGERITPAHHTLAALSRILPRTALVVSFFGSTSRVPSRAFKPLVRLADALTTSTREDLMQLKRMGLLNSFQTTEVILPFFYSQAWAQRPGVFLNSDVSTEAFQGEIPQQNPPVVKGQDLERLLSSLGNFVLLPFPAKEIKKKGPGTQREPRLKKVYLCPRPLDFTDESSFFVPLLGSLDDYQELFDTAKALVLTQSELSPQELLFYRELSHRFSLPIVADRRQIEQLPGLISNEKTGWLFDGPLDQLPQFLTEHLRPLADLARTRPEGSSLLDSALNDLNRIYQRAFDSKLLAFR